MDAKLLELRSTVYSAAINFHRVAADYFTALRRRETVDEKAPVAVTVEESAGAYENALDDLLSHLRALESTPEMEEEIQRTLRLQELLQDELHLMLRPTPK